MSRIGKLPINIPENVNVNYNEKEIVVKGRFGTLIQNLPDVINFNQTDSRESNFNSWIKKRNKKSSRPSRFI